MEAQADTNAADAQQRTALHMAAEVFTQFGSHRGKLDCAKSLLGAGALQDLPDANGRTLARIALVFLICLLIVGFKMNAES